MITNMRIVAREQNRGGQTSLQNLRCEAESCIGLIENVRQLFLHCQRNIDREVRAAKKQCWY